MGQWLLKKHKINQPRPQGFSLKKWVGPPPFFEGKALGTRLKINNKTKNSRQFSSHALRYASLITCLPNSFLIGQMSRRDQSVRQTTKRGHLC